MQPIVIIALILASQISWAATIYVDPTLGADITNGTYSCANRNNTGSDGNAYNTLQDVLWGTNGTDGAAGAGDTIYLRGATYKEAWGDSSGSRGAAMQIPTRLNGSAWTSGNYTTMASYPGEWAVIDGSSTGSYFCGLGYGVQARGEVSINPIRYFVFERLEITGGQQSGLGICQGPVKVRYCYVHNNGKGESGDDNRAGINFCRVSGATIEYCYFYDNTDGEANHNQADIMNYTDYLNEATFGSFNATYCDMDNDIRYNYFGGGAYVGYKEKASQLLAARTQPNGRITDMTYSTKGNRIHHNIMRNSVAIYSQQDFAQLYNNIADGGVIAAEGGSLEIPAYYQSAYNNTVISAGARIYSYLGYDRTPYGWEETLDMAWFCCNNIIEGHSTSDGIIDLACHWDAAAGSTYIYDNTTIDRNLIHNTATSSQDYNMPDSVRSASYRYTTAQFNTLRSATNYINSTSGLFVGASGADEYKTVSSFVVGSSTIANGGIGGNHPYLAGVTIPSYIGATNPDDDAWVAGVLAMDATYFTNQTAGSTPTWIEGSTSSRAIKNGGVRNGGIR